MMLRPWIRPIALTLTLITVACSASDNASVASANGGGANLGGAQNTGGLAAGGSSSSAPGAGGTSTTGGSTIASGVDPRTERFEVPTMTIDVVNGAAITSKEAYVSCTVTIDGKGSFANYTGQAGIRGRGNSTWLWYDKKPYRIKLNEGSPILGLKQNKDWVLLANYRDPTFLMNSFAFEVANWMGLPYSNHSRFVEVTLNGDYIGLYELTEQIEQGANRVAVPDVGGILLSLDLDDGPSMAPTSGDNFDSTKYKLPVCVKYPGNQTAAQLLTIKEDFAKLEQAISTADYNAVAAVLDIPSFIDFLILQELTYNVELVSPRSMYLHKSPGGVYVMGPVWDFDGGFDFDWTDMMTSHDYFAAQDLVMGADPARAGTVSLFWVNMFKNARFVTEYKARWAAIKDTLMPQCWGVMQNYVTSISGALGRNAQRWPIGKDANTEIGRLKQWLDTRVTKLTTVINGYPAN